MPAAGGGPARCWLRTASRRASPRLSTRSSATTPFSKTQVRAILAGGDQPGLAADAERTIRLDEVISSGDLGYALGVVVVRIPSGRELSTKYATIWQRDADGRWRLAVDSSSPNP
jgi:ketosteroid isomerase-like protein